jgi:lipid A oxidase
MPTRLTRIAMMIGLAVLASPTPVCVADTSISVYFGKGDTRASDARLTETSGTTLDVAKVHWADRSFSAPVYYGLRINYWPSDSSVNGVALDFTHAKIYADVEQAVDVSGTRNHTAVQGSEALSNTFSELAFSHGYNLLTINALHRWLPDNPTDAHAIKPYIGAGMGIAVPHVEIKTASGATSEYQYAGVVYQAMAGVNYRVSGNWDLFVEYKLSLGDLNVDLHNNGNLKLKPLTQHFTVGGSLDIP